MKRRDSILALTFFEFFLLGAFSRNIQKMSKDSSISVSCLGELGNSSFWNNEEVHGRLWADVTEGKASIVFVDDVRRDFLANDLVEERFFVSLAALVKF